MKDMIAETNETSVKPPFVYDIAGIGIGPFNLGLAALVKPIKNLSSIFFESRPSFEWHNGLMFEFAQMQVPFYADLVTAAEPSSHYSFFSYLKRSERLYQFAIMEDNYITRREYYNYCTWVSQQLDNLLYNHYVTDIVYDQENKYYVVTTRNNGEVKMFTARHIVIGTGSQPYIPENMSADFNLPIFHSSNYLYRKHELVCKSSVAVVGSGQSAAEIFYDLLTERNSELDELYWITKADRFYAMETSKFSYEMTSPDYIDYFFRLPAPLKAARLKQQDGLYKGINAQLLTEIYKVLYHKAHTPTAVRLYPQTKVEDIGMHNFEAELSLYQHELCKRYQLRTSGVVLATGYTRNIPAFVSSISDRISWDDSGTYDVSRNYSISKTPDEIFVQNAELHSHGFNAPDLGMGPYRNTIIINSILGYEHYKVEKNIAFQQFNLCDSVEGSSGLIE